MKGHIQQRGKNSWRLKFDAGRDERTGERNIQYHTFHGTKRQAQIKLAELIASVAQAKYVEPNKVTVAEWVRAERYRELVENQIAPHIGARLLQKLRTLDIEEWHTALRNSGRADGKGGLAPRTIGHAHRVLGKALRDAAKNELVVKNVVAGESAPKVDDEEMVIVQDIPAFIESLRGHRLFVPAMISLFTGMRIGEVLALRWAVSIWTERSFRSAKRWKKPGRTGSGSRRRSPRPAGATSPCPTFWSICCATSAKSSWNCALSSAPGSFPTTRCCSPA
jgi:integrase